MPTSQGDAGQGGTDVRTTTKPVLRTSRTRRRSTRTALAASAAVVLLAAGLAGCSGAPRAVFNVPGTYVADLWAPTVENPSGGPSATVLMCLDEASAVHLKTGQGSEGGIGTIRLDWQGTLYSAPSNGSTITYTTPVLQPGCGLLTFGVDCCHVDHYLAVEATKV